MRKKKVFIVFMILTMLSVMVSCGNKGNDSQSNEKNVLENGEKVKSLTYSNLVDEESQKLVKDALKEAGIKEETTSHFIEDVRAFNKTVGHVGLVEKGFKTIDSLKPEYDNAKMADALEKNYPKILWHNCRLTTFRLMNDFIEVKNPKIDDSTMLFQDEETIDKDKSIVGARKKDFLSLFSYSKTKNTDDVNEHIKRIQETWKEKGISFQNPKISVITVLFNTNIEERDDTSQLFIGHAGMLWEGKDGKLYFLEKISFMEPYQLDVFNNRQELSDYLMDKYDVDIGQKTSIPFVLENGELIEGFRPNGDKALE